MVSQCRTGDQLFIYLYIGDAEADGIGKPGTTVRGFGDSST